MSLEWKKVLLVEDDESACQNLSRLIERHYKNGLNVEPICVHSLSAAKARWVQNNIALVVLDRGLPDADDIEEWLAFIRIVTPTTPLIVMTGFEDPELFKAMPRRRHD